MDMVTTLLTKGTDFSVAPASKGVPTLASQEKIIANAIGMAVEAIGGALLAIRDHRLYRAAGYERFQDYCDQQWGFRKSRADQYISFHLVVRELSTNVEMRGVPLPRSEAQTRPLRFLKGTERRAAVWKDVLELHGERATMAQVENAVQYHLAVEADPAKRGQQREEVIRQYREAKKTSNETRRVPALPTPTLTTPSSDDTRPHWELVTVQTTVSDLYATRYAWFAAITKHERPKVNDLIGDLRLLADALESQMQIVRDEEPIRLTEESSRGVTD